MADLIELLQSSGPIPLDELNMRVSETPVELVQKIEELRKRGVVAVTGPQSENLSNLTPEEIENSAETVVELSRSSLRRSFAS
jgi:DNA-binding Lrp family transcriptional regulator